MLGDLKEAARKTDLEFWTAQKHIGRLFQRMPMPWDGPCGGPLRLSDAAYVFYSLFLKIV